MLGVSENGVYPWLAASELLFFLDLPVDGNWKSLRFMTTEGTTLW